MVRAPERRVWNIETGRMTAGKKQQYIQKLINKYKRQVNYNPETGAVDATQNIQSLSQDYWFSKTEGQGTDVTTLGGGQQLGELDDVNYFLGKLYKVLKMPKDRFSDPNSQYNSSSSLEREEIRFTKFINRCQNRFKKVIMDVFIQQLRLQGIDKEYIDRNLYDIRFSKSNYFEAYKEMDVLESKVNLWSSLEGYTVTPDNPDGAFSREYVLRHLLHMTDEEWKLNEELKDKEKEKAKKNAEDNAEFQRDIEVKYGIDQEGALSDTQPSEPTNQSNKENE